MQKTIPYDKLSLIYDRLMDHVDYKFWSSYIRSFFRYADIKVKNVLDISCGTGNLLTHLVKTKYNFIGCDFSKDMLREATQKKSLAKVSFFINDIRFIALCNESFDCILFLYDSINYILKKSDISQIFSEIERVLQKGGIFIFDTITESHCKEYYNDFYDSEFWGEEGYYRHSYYDQKSFQQHNEFRIILNKKTYYEHHVQRVYTIDELKQLLQKHNFKISGMFDNFSFNEVDTESDRVHFVCKKL